MDVPQEPVRYKSHLLFGFENDSASVLLTFLGAGFFSDKRKTCRRQGETTVNKHQPDWMSEDEPSPPLSKANLFKAYLSES